MLQEVYGVQESWDSVDSSPIAEVVSLDRGSSSGEQ